jgi:septal ring factor EnvC (AmiA/AmiB activator)
VNARRARTFAAVALAALLPLAALAQQGGRGRSPDQELTESQRRLQEIRAERSQLRNELSGIRSRVHDVTSEIRNIQRQREVSAALLRELNFQMS